MNAYIEYARHVGLDQFGLDWVTKIVGAQLKKQELLTEEVEHIIDWLASDNRPPRIAKCSYSQAKTATEKWMKSQIKKGGSIKELPSDTEIVLDFKDGFKVVKLVGENAYKREGFLMRHCVAGYYGRGVEIYSLRDADNTPHCTMEKNQQVKGKGNGDIHPKYISYVVKFLEHVGMRVGDSEMAHLGYMNLEEFKDEIDAKELFNEKYHPKDKKILDKNGEQFCDLGLWNKTPLLEFSANSSVDFKINFDLASFIKVAIGRLFTFLKDKKWPSFKTKNDNGKDSAQIGSSGHSAQIGSSGDSAKIGSSGHSAKIGSSGHYAQIGSSGHSAKIGSSGHYAKIGSSGDSAQIGSSGDSAKIEINGEDSIGMNAGRESIIKGKKGNWITLSEWVVKNDRWVPFCVKSAQIDGKILKEDTFYKLVKGEFEEVL